MSAASTPAHSDYLRLSERAQRVQPSPTLAITARARTLISQGRDLVLFGAGEPDFPTPEHVRRATSEALERGLTRYTATAGLIELRRAVADDLQRQIGIGYAPEDIIVAAGAKMALYELFQAVCQPGDEVIVFAPYWVSYCDMVELAGATPVIVPTRAEDGFLPDPERLREALSPRTRAVVINSPGNPTGAVYERETLEAIARVIEPTSALVITDDIYGRLMFDGRSFNNIAQLSPEWAARTVVINGVSKTYAMTGFRIGWAAGPRSIIQAMGRIQDQSTSGPTSFAQAGAVAALTGPHDFLDAAVTEFTRRRDLFVDGLSRIEGVTCTRPGGAFYVFPSVAPFLGRRWGDRVIDTTTALCEVLLEEVGLALIPGDAFGAPEHVRLSFATTQREIERGLERLAEGLGALR